VRLDGPTRNDDVSPDLALLAVERAIPIRRFFAWPGKRNYEGFPPRLIGVADCCCR
jgi:hypothetical protein